MPYKVLAGICIYPLQPPAQQPPLTHPEYQNAVLFLKLRALFGLYPFVVVAVDQII
jgi:hypothetical protein